MKYYTNFLKYITILIFTLGGNYDIRFYYSLVEIL